MNKALRVRERNRSDCSTKDDINVDYDVQKSVCIVLVHVSPHSIYVSVSSEDLFVRRCVENYLLIKLQH